MRAYEMVFIVDPRVPDEEVVTLTSEYREMITAGGGEVTREESWGKRKLAYPINKVNEGKYVLFEVATEGTNPLPQVEHRMRQNDKVLRYLTVRTDTERRPEPAAERPVPATDGPPPLAEGRPAPRESRPAPRESRQALREGRAAPREGRQAPGEGESGAGSRARKVG